MDYYKQKTQNIQKQDKQNHQTKEVNVKNEEKQFYKVKQGIIHDKIIPTVDGKNIIPFYLNEAEYHHLFRWWMNA